MTTAIEPTLTIRRAEDDGEIPVRPITVEEYHRMIEVGILDEDDRVELLEGLLVVKSPQKPPHATTVTLLNDALTPLIAPRWYVRMQLPITLRDSEPEPDIVVVPTPARRFKDQHPTADDVALIAQASRTSLRHDRSQLGRIFAAAGIPAYWIVNLIDSVVEVYTQPQPARSRRRSAGYAQRTDYHPVDSVPLILAGQQLGSIPVADLLP